MRAFPALLDDSDGGLTAEQELAIDIQLVLDEGHVLCSGCESLVPHGAHCARCGAALVVTTLCRNDGCRAPMSGRYCSQCGRDGRDDDLVDRIRRGETTFEEAAGAGLAAWRAQAQRGGS